MRIAYFTDTFSPQINGVANTMNYLTEYLNKKNIDYLLFAPEYDSNDLSVKQSLSVVRCKGIRPVFYPECSLAFPNYLLLKNRIASFNPDLIHITTEYGIGLCGLMAARDLKIPIVMSYHTNFDRYLNSYGLQHLSSAYWHYMKWFHHFAALNLCPSIDTKNNLNRKGFHDLGIWSRGVDLKDFGPQHYSQNMRDELGGKNAVIFQYAGRLSKEKGLDTLAESIPILSQKFGNRVRFVFTGDGPYRKDLETKKLPNTIFTGAKTKKELAVIYASCDAFMFPSGTETFGNVVLEAMASGLPVISVDSGGIKDFTINGYNSIICPYHDTQSFTRGMMHLAADASLRNVLRNGALETAAMRTWDTILEQLTEEYRQVLIQYRNDVDTCHTKIAV